MFRKITEYERARHIHKYLTTGEPFNLNRDLGDIYQMSSNGTDLKFYDMVKIRKTGKTYHGKEILLFNVTQYCYVNLEERSKWSLIQELERLFGEIFFGFEIGSYKDESNGRWNILSRRLKYSIGKAEPAESEQEHHKRTFDIYNDCVKMSKGLCNNYEIFFVGDDHQMVKPLDFIGYFDYLARCLNGIEVFSYYRERDRNKLQMFFGSDAIDINERYHTYVEIANILGVQYKMEDIVCRFNSLEQIQKEVKSRCYIFHEVAKYFFKNGRKFSDEDHKNILKRSYNIRAIYSALGGKYCMKANEEKHMIAYFTALRCTKDDLPLLMNTNDAAMDVLRKRFDLSR